MNPSVTPEIEMVSDSCDISYVSGSRAEKKRIDKIQNGFPIDLRPQARIGCIDDEADVFKIYNDGDTPSPRKQVDVITDLCRVITWQSRRGMGATFKLGDVAFIAVMKNRIVSLAIVASQMEYHPSRITGNPTSPLEPTGSSFSDGTRHAVVALWTLESYRRNGYSKALVGILAQDLGVTIRDLAWYTPFSPEGEAFLVSVVGNEILAATSP